MIPLKLKTFLETILEKTESNIVRWNVLDDEVFITGEAYSLTVKFDFDEDEEIPYFKIFYSYGDKDITIIEKNYERDYELIGNIFKSAKASNLDFPF